MSVHLNIFLPNLNYSSLHMKFYWIWQKCMDFTRFFYSNIQWK